MDMISYSLSKKIASSAVSGVSSMSVDGTTLNIDTNDGQRLQMVFPQPKDGVSVTDIDVNANNQIVFTMSDGTEIISGVIPTVKGQKGDPGVTPNLTIGTVETLDACSNATATITGDRENPVLNLGIPKGVDGQGGSNQEDYRWQYVEGVIYPCSFFNCTTLTLQEGGSGVYTCMRYEFDGSEKYIRLSANTGGSLKYLAYIILDENNNILDKADEVTGKGYKDIELPVPNGAKTIWLNGNNYVSVHLEISQSDLRSDLKTLDKLLKEMMKKVSYRNKFAWKPMPTGLIAFTFDDSLDDIGAVVDIFIEKGVPCCFGAIPEYLNKGISSGSVGEETVAQAMKRAVDAVGAEVLAHGSSTNEIVVENNIDDMNFLYNKFVVNKQKLTDLGFNVRGTVRVGGNGNICNDPRTDVWCRAFFDYGDLYGVEEPYNHARFSGSTTESYYAAIDRAISEKTFTPLLFHRADLEELPKMIDYVIANGGQIVNYATAYDTYGSIVETVDILNRISAIENSDGNEVAY